MDLFSISDIFNYPLTQEQVTHYLINNKSLKSHEVEESVKKAADFVKEYNGYICLKNKKKFSIEILCYKTHFC